MFPALEGLVAGPRVVDSSGILNLTQLPQRLGILGGGYIGVEFASMFAGFGSEVTLFESAPQFLAREDDDISAAIAGILQEQGVKLELNTALQRVTSGRDSVTLHTAQGDREVDVLLVATGRRPATKALKLENLKLPWIISGRWAMLPAGHSLTIFRLMISASFTISCWARARAPPKTALTSRIPCL